MEVIYLLLHSQHQHDFCIKVGSDARAIVMFH